MYSYTSENNINNGTLREIPEFHIDLFTRESINWDTNRAFLLTHAHSDHIDGLFGYFLTALNERPSEVYCLYMHELTYHLLHFWNANKHSLARFSAKYSYFDNLLKSLKNGGWIKFLEKNASYVFNFGTGTDLWNLIPLSAGHHPGSLMFLFEKMNYGSANSNSENEKIKCILYTGDCRLNMNDLQYTFLLHDKNSYLYDNHGIRKRKVKSIDVLYIDTTFALERNDGSEFESRREVTNIILNHIENRPGEKFQIWMAGYMTQLYLVMRVFAWIKEPMCVIKSVHDFCEKIPELQGKTSSSEICDHDTGSNLQSCPKISHVLHRVKKIKNPYNNKRNFDKSPPNTFKLQAQKPKFGQINDEFGLFLTRHGIHPGSYSMHLSRNELKRTICYLKPKKCIPLVIPKSDEIDNRSRTIKIREIENELNNLHRKLVENQIEPPAEPFPENDFPSFVFDFTGKNWTKPGEILFEHYHRMM